MEGMTHKQLHKVNSVMMMNDKFDAQFVIKLSNINDECTTPLSWVSSSRTQCKGIVSLRNCAIKEVFQDAQCDAGGADYVKTRSSCLRS